jgi:hypothetical protein
MRFFASLRMTSVYRVRGEREVVGLRILKDFLMGRK